VSVHFIGFRGDEFNRAIRIFGQPNFIHMWHDHRMYGDVGDGDTLVFANKADPNVISQYSWQDHELW
jgi:hypothetical protein